MKTNENLQEKENCVISPIINKLKWNKSLWMPSCNLGKKGLSYFMLSVELEKEK